MFKVANTSINKSMFFKEKEASEDTPYYKLTETYRIATCKRPKDCFTFSFVRNPFDKLFSCYKNKVEEPKLRGELPFPMYLFGYIGTINSFESFIKKIDTLPNKICEDHFKPQYNILYKRGVCIADYIRRYESLEKDYEPIRKKYGFGELLLLNQSQKQKEWKKHYNKELADIVYKKYQKDFELWYPNAYDELISYLDNQTNRQSA